MLDLAHTHTHTHSSTGYRPASSGPQNSDSMGARQNKESDIDGNSLAASLQFLWEREQERGRRRDQGLDGEGRAGIARKDIDFQRIHEREKAKALKAQGLDQFQSRTEWGGEAHARGLQEESSCPSPFAGRFAFCAYACYCVHTAAASFQL
jgi:hypothetical protein